MEAKSAPEVDLAGPDSVISSNATSGHPDSRDHDVSVDIVGKTHVQDSLLFSHLKHILNMLKKTFFLTFGVTSVAGANKVGDY